MERKELIESLAKWDHPPYVAEASLEMIHSHVLNESPLLLKRWYERDEVIIITPSRHEMTQRQGVRVDLESCAIIDEPIAIGKVMRHIQITTDDVLHRYSVVELISFYPEGSQVPMENIDYSVVDEDGLLLPVNIVNSYLKKILTYITTKR